MAVEKIKILEAVLELPAKPIYQEIGQNGPNWPCCLAGSSKMAHRILIFTTAMGASILYEINSYLLSPPKSCHINNSFLNSVVAIVR